MPTRQDEKWFAGLLFNNAALKFTAAILLMSNIMFMVFVLALWNKGKEVYVFDGSSGRSYGTSGKLTLKDMDIMFLSASKNFIDDFLNFDGATIEKARLRAYMRMSPSLKAKYGKDLGKKQSIDMAIKRRSKYSLKYEMGPRIIKRAYPYFKTFMKVRRKIVHNDGRYSEVDMFFVIGMTRRQPTMEFPDGIWITDIEQIDKDDTKTINEIINLIQ